MSILGKSTALTANDHHASVKDANGRRIPARSGETQMDGILKNKTTITIGRSTRFKDSDSVVPGANSGVAGEKILVASNANLEAW